MGYHHEDNDIQTRQDNFVIIPERENQTPHSVIACSDGHLLAVTQSLGLKPSEVMGYNRMEICALAAGSRPTALATRTLSLEFGARLLGHSLRVDIEIKLTVFLMNNQTVAHLGVRRGKCRTNHVTISSGANAKARCDHILIPTGQPDLLSQLVAKIRRGGGFRLEVSERELNVIVIPDRECFCRIPSTGLVLQRTLLVGLTVCMEGPTSIATSFRGQIHLGYSYALGSG